jgi:hypothetical protein
LELPSFLKLFLDPLLLTNELSTTDLVPPWKGQLRSIFLVQLMLFTCYCHIYGGGVGLGDNSFF